MDISQRAFLSAQTSSFADFAKLVSPEVLPQASQAKIPHGTTIVAATYQGGVVMAGDRRATMGSMIAQRDIEKVFLADSSSVIGIAGVAGLATELVRLFQVELEHYEKIEGVALSVEGKAHRLASMLRGHLSLALSGLVVVPLLAGWDQRLDCPRIFSYDPTGGCYEEHGFHAIGSGSPFARGSLKKTYRDDMSESEAAASLVQALFDAADDDSATSGPDVARAIYPIVCSVNAQGVRRFDNDEVAKLSQQVMS